MFALHQIILIVRKKRIGGKKMSQKKVTKKELLIKAAEFDLKGVQKLKKEALIHEIQIAEGNDACFANIQNCAVSPCLYRAECQTA